MARRFSNRDRLVELGVLTTERLPRDALAASVAAPQPGDLSVAGADSVAGAVPEYRQLFASFFVGARAPARAPVPDDLAVRSRNLKTSAYFLDATLAGACRLEVGDWHVGEPTAHTHAFVFLIEFGREPEAGEPGADWIRGSNVARTNLRCAELGWRS